MPTWPVDCSERNKDCQKASAKRRRKNRGMSLIVLDCPGVIKLMTIPPEALARLSRTVQPLVFETGIDDTPYSTLGTVFLVGYEGRAFVLTTHHTLNPENLVPICIFPSDSSHRVLPMKDVFFVPRAQAHEDSVDLAVIEIDLAQITDTELGQVTIVDLALASGDWLSCSESTEFVVLGCLSGGSLVCRLRPRDPEPGPHYTSSNIRRPVGSALPSRARSAQLAVAINI